MSTSFRSLFAVGLLAIPGFASAATVNIDFNGERNNDFSSAGTYVGPSAVIGSGTVFNPLAAISATLGGSTNDDNLTVSQSNLLSDTGIVTTVGFSAVGVGGDSNPDNTATNIPLATDPAALFRDYIFNPAARDYTFSGLVPKATVDVYVYTQGLNNYSISTGAPAHFTTSPGFSDFLSVGNTLLWAGVTVDDSGNVIVHAPDVDVISGFTITGPGVAVPEPTALSLLAVGAIGLTTRRRRA